jgi:hypothetical protein
MKLRTITLLSALVFTAQVKAQNLDNDSFGKLINEVLSPYMQELKSISPELKLNIDWQSDHPNASVSMRKGKVHMNFHGGFVRENGLSADAFAMTVCHEIGHLLGGYPKVFPTQKYSAEAQSDYFATASCIKKYFKLSPRKVSAQELEILSDDQKSLCSKKENCLRGLVAISSLSQAYKGEKDINSYSNEIVNVTNYNDYPSAQCRIDTLRAGLLCNSSECLEGPGKRPSCWYNTSDHLVPRWDYKPGVDLPEAQIMGESGKVTPRPWGCHVEVVDIDYHAPSYFNPLYEDEIMDKGFNIVGPCVISENSSFSGPITSVKENLFYNVNSADKSSKF